VEEVASAETQWPPREQEGDSQFGKLQRDSLRRPEWPGKLQGGETKTFFSKKKPYSIRGSKKKGRRRRNERNPGPNRLSIEKVGLPG